MAFVMEFDYELANTLHLRPKMFYRGCILLLFESNIKDDG